MAEDVRLYWLDQLVLKLVSVTRGLPDGRQIPVLSYLRQTSGALYLPVISTLFQTCVCSPPGYSKRATKDDDQVIVLERLLFCPQIMWV